MATRIEAGKAILDIVEGLIKLEYNLENCTIECVTLNEGRIRVKLNSIYIGIWDTARKTYVD